MTRYQATLLMLAATALVQTEAASAQSCVSEAEVSALFVYSMPSVLESARNSCDGKLSRDGFFATNGSRLIGRYAALQNETWPKAKRALLLYAGSGKGNAPKLKNAPDALRNIDPAQLLGSLPDNVVRPMVDAIIVQKVAEQVKPQSCRNIERVAAAISPIEPSAAAVLLGTVMSLVGLNNPDICTAKS